MAQNNNGRAVLQSAAGFGAVLLAAIGVVSTIFQIQISALKEHNETQFKLQSVTVNELRKIGEDTSLRLASELNRREGDIKTQLTVIQNELDRLRRDFLSTDAFAQFQARMVAELGFIKAQLITIEQTRPTTGELGGLGKNLSEQVQRLEERLRYLEQRAIQPK